MSGAMPAVWGADQLLAFSGIDGKTRWARPFVLATGPAPGSLLVRLPVPVEVSFGDLGEVRWEMILGDVLVGGTGRGRFQAAFADHDLLVGETPPGSVMHVDGRPVGPSPTVVAESGEARVYALQEAHRWALGCCHGAEAPRGLPAVRLDDIVADRTRWVRSRPVPGHLSAEETRLLRKAMSVMKVNVHAAQGRFGRRWSTPDRWPHQHLWLWDSAFHAVGMCRLDPALAQDEILAVLEQAREDGMVPHMACPDGHRSDITQPPLLAWAVLEVLDHGGGLDWAQACLGPLEAYLDWDRCHRDRNGNGIPEWFIQGDPLCRCGESGLDNASVYDRAVCLDAPDFAAFLANDYACLARIARRLGSLELARRAGAVAEEIGRALEALLWCEPSGLYCHRTFAGQHVPVKAISGFMPLFAGIASRRRAAALVAHLHDPATFGAPSPVPSEALDSGTYCKDMWRGPTWVNLSYLVLLGLRVYGYADEARRLKRRLLDTVLQWWMREGCLFEYYDSLACTSPRDLDRKQRLISGGGIAPIADYHWTASLTAALMLEAP